MDAMTPNNVEIIDSNDDAATTSIWIGYINVNEYQETTEEWNQLLSLVEPKTEMERMKRYFFHIDAKRSCLGHVLMRHYLQQELNLSELARVQFKRTSENKPYLIIPLEQKLQQQQHASNSSNSSNSVIDFNISHGGDLVILGFVHSRHRSSDRILGIDVEKLEFRTTRNASQPYQEYLETMESCFTELEWRCILKSLQTVRGHHNVHHYHYRTLFKGIDQLVQSNRPLLEAIIERFFVHWTLKESFMKATGMGVGIELQRMQFEFKNEEELYVNNNDQFTEYPSLVHLKPRLRLDGRILSGWTFSICKVGQSHVASVCLGPLHVSNTIQPTPTSTDLKQSLLRHLPTHFNQHNSRVEDMNDLQRMEEQNLQLLQKSVPFEHIVRPPNSLFDQ